MKHFRLSTPVHGWMDVSIGVEPEIQTLTVSDVPNDCLGDLATAVVRLLSGSGEENVELSLEPDFALLQLISDGGLVRVRLFLPSHSQPLLEAYYPLDAFARGLKFELQRIKPFYGSPDSWTQPFPEREVANLP